MTPNELMEYSGGNLTTAAHTAQVKENTVRNWLAAGSIPAVQQRSIEVLTKGKLKADK